MLPVVSRASIHEICGVIGLREILESVRGAGFGVLLAEYARMTPAGCSRQSTRAVIGIVLLMIGLAAADRFLAQVESSEIRTSAQRAYAEGAQLLARGDAARWICCGRRMRSRGKIPNTKCNWLRPRRRRVKPRTPSRCSRKFCTRTERRASQSGGGAADGERGQYCGRAGLLPSGDLRAVVLRGGCYSAAARGWNWSTFSLRAGKSRSCWRS